jgi:hypothetical protein
MAVAREDWAAVLERLLGALRRPALVFGLLLGLAISGVLAIPWFGGSSDRRRFRRWPRWKSARRRRHARSRRPRIH